MANLKRAWIHYRSSCPRCSNRRQCCLVSNARVLVRIAVQQLRESRQQRAFQSSAVRYFHGEAN